MDNESRAKRVLEEYKFSFDEQYRLEIISLLEDEIQSYQSGSSEYLRVLCGFLFCIGNKEDAELLRKVKYKINFDVQNMIDIDWINSLSGIETSSTRDELIKRFIDYYRHYFNLDF